MLETLRIQNYALIDTLEVQFQPGLNALTGETGAGKSIIIGALNLVLGARASSDSVRTGAKSAKIDALFHLVHVSPRLTQLLDEHELELQDGELLLSRVVSVEGRSRAYACGSLIPLSVLAAIGDELVDLHGQHAHQSLLKIDRQLELLDAFGGNGDLRKGVAKEVAALREVEGRIEALQTSDREQERRIEFLRFEIGEIDKANLQPDEEADTRARRDLITNAENIVSQANAAIRALADGEDAPTALDSLRGAIGHLDSLAEIGERFESLGQRLYSILSDLESVVDDVRSLTGEVDFDPQELDDLNARLSLIGDLKRKYGDSVEEVLAHRARAAAEIDAHENKDTLLADLNAQREAIEQRALGHAKRLSKKRKASAKTLHTKITESLWDLGMAGGSFRVELAEQDLGPTGVDRAEFLLTANAGEAPKPLRQVASGGEISRVMLALKAVFASADEVPTLIFDEIDSGVGGAVALKVGAKLSDLAASHQTICVTHLAQIAAAADAHYRVTKVTLEERTRTLVQALEGEGRTDEVARLLDGAITEISSSHARALLHELAPRRTQKKVG